MISLEREFEEVRAAGERSEARAISWFFEKIDLRCHNNQLIVDIDTAKEWIISARNDRDMYQSALQAIDALGPATPIRVALEIANNALTAKPFTEEEEEICPVCEGISLPDEMHCPECESKGKQK
jgi:hypothetical protein